MVILYRRFGQLIGPIFKGEEVQQEEKKHLKMGPIGFPETSVKDYHSTLRNIPEEGRYQQNTRLYGETYGCCIELGLFLKTFASFIVLFSNVAVGSKRRVLFCLMARVTTKLLCA